MKYRAKTISAFMAAGLASGGCTTDDIAAFSQGLAMAADELEAELNACPPGLIRTETYEPYMPGVGGYGGQVVYYGLTPYVVRSNCNYPYYPVSDADEESENYREGYEEGYRDARRRDRDRDDRR